MNCFGNIIYMKAKQFIFIFILFVGNKIFSENFFYENAQANLKLNFPFTELSLSWKKDNLNFGIDFFSDKFLKKYPFSLKVGTLSFSSPLKSPELSSSSPFSSVKKKATSFSARIPSYSSFPEEISYFAQFGFLDSKKLINKANLNFFYAQDSKFAAFSSFIKCKISKKIDFSHSFVFNSFCFDDSNFSSWFSERFFFHKDRFSCFYNQFVLNLYNFTSVFSLYAYESCFGNFNFVYKTENMLKLNHLVLNFSGFYNSNKNIYTPSQNFLNENLQLKTGIQYNFMLRKKIPIFIKNGANAFFDYQPARENQNLKISLGSQLNFLNTSFYLIGSADSKIICSQSQNDFSFEKYSLSIKNNWNFEKISFFISGTYKFSPKSQNQDFSQTYNANFYFGRKQKIFLTNSFSLSYYEKRLSKYSYNGSFGAKWKIKFLNLNGKISWKI